MWAQGGGQVNWENNTRTEDTIILGQQDTIMIDEQKKPKNKIKFK